MNTLNSIQKVNWQGASGRLYTYLVYSLPGGAPSSQPGNYIYTTIVQGKWVPLHIGQGHLHLETSITTHTLSSWLLDNGVSHVHAHINSVEQDRLSEEADLLAAFPGIGGSQL